MESDHFEESTHTTTYGILFPNGKNNMSSAHVHELSLTGEQARTPPPASAASHNQPFVVERAADLLLQQQQRIADLERQCGLSGPKTREEPPPVKPINIRHGCPRCATCDTLLRTVSELETMLHHKDSDCDALRRSLDDAQRVNALLLEQVEMLQRGLERAISERPSHQYLANMSPSPPAQSSGNSPSQFFSQPPSAAAAAPAPIGASSSARLYDPTSDVTLRAMADAVMSLQQLWTDNTHLKLSRTSLQKAASPSPSVVAAPKSSSSPSSALPLPSLVWQTATEAMAPAAAAAAAVGIPVVAVPAVAPSAPSSVRTVSSSVAFQVPAAAPASAVPAVARAQGEAEEL